MQALVVCLYWCRGWDLNPSERGDVANKLSFSATFPFFSKIRFAENSLVFYGFYKVKVAKSPAFPLFYSSKSRLTLTFKS